MNSVIMDDLELGDEMINWKTADTALYQALPKEIRENWQVCDPLRELPRDYPVVFPGPEDLYKPRGKRI